MKLIFILVTLVGCIYGNSVSEFGEKPLIHDVVIKSVDFSNFPDYYHFLPHNVSVTDEKSIITPRAGITAELNDWIDQVFKNIGKFMILNGIDPTQLPDAHAGFEYKLLFITYSGDFDLKHGWLNDMATINRGSRDFVISYVPGKKIFRAQLPIAFEDLAFTYDYSIKIMHLGPSGGIEGKITNLKILVDLEFDAETLHAELKKFDITNAGHITFRFTGNILVDWLLNLVTGVATTLLKQVILLVVENIVRGGLGSVVDTINNFIDGILNGGNGTDPTLINMLNQYAN